MIEDTATQASWAALFGLLGLAVGSFLNVVIHRVPQRASVVSPPSHCPECDASIRRRDNVPVVSWLLLRGRCRDCGATIPVRYPLVELTTGAVFGALAWRFEAGWELGGFLLMGATLVAIAIIDLEHYIVPNRILVPVVPVAVGLLGIAALAEGAWGDLLRGVLGGVTAFGGLLVVHLISPRGMGMGDVKLALLLGLFLGWLSWGHVALGLFVGFLLGAVVGGALVISRVRTRKEPVPFAPFLAAGTVVATLWGSPLLDWYAGL